MYISLTISRWWALRVDALGKVLTSQIVGSRRAGCLFFNLFYIQVLIQLWRKVFSKGESIEAGQGAARRGGAGESRSLNTSKVEEIDLSRFLSRSKALGVLQEI